MGYDVRYSGQLNIVPDVSAKVMRAINNLQGEEEGAPDSHCDFEVNADGDAIEHNGDEKTHDDGAWIKFIIETYLKPNGHVVNGTLEATGEDGARWNVTVENNVVYIQDIEEKLGKKKPV